MVAGQAALGDRQCRGVSAALEPHAAASGYLFQPNTIDPSTTAASANMPAIALQPVSVSTFSSPAGVSAPLSCVNVSGCAASE